MLSKLSLIAASYKENMPINVVHINTTDIKGGAGRAAYRLHLSLKMNGAKSLMFVLNRYSGDEDVIKYDSTAQKNMFERQGIRKKIIARALRKYKNNISERYELFSDDRSPYTHSVKNQIPKSDIINLHWVSGFVDYSSFFPHEKPIVWTLHDMNPFTGGCHYNNDCTKYLTGCGTCPQLGSTEEVDLSRRIWARKQKIFHAINPSRLTIVTPSTWLADKVMQSPLLGHFNTSVIPNSVDLTRFKPLDKKVAREILDLPMLTKIVLFVADSIMSKRKGFCYLAEALSGLNPAQQCILLSIGRNKPLLQTSIPHIHLGEVFDDRILFLIYNAADIFTIPSLQDNLPNTILESMACGTPVVGFNVGGIPDVIQNHRNGILVEPQNSKDLCTAIEYLINNQDILKKMSTASRHTIETVFSPQNQSRSYSNLYNTLV
jgi:glycosyltransferase involved in cell wall biosynthesis